jgi:alpha-tubulin N-acetyltransferase 1
MSTGQHTCYFKAEDNKCIGFIKVGYKTLFVRTRSSQLVEMNPLCVLDFYVSEKVQRGGFGKLLFDAMLEYENQHPAKLAYDRPSKLLTGFLGKHFNLKSFVPQNNNYVVFDEYFNN